MMYKALLLELTFIQEGKNKQTNKQTRNLIFVLTFVPAMIFWLILAAILVARFSLAGKDANKKSITTVLAYFLILEIRWIKIKI